MNEVKAVIAIVQKKDKFLVLKRSPTRKSMPNKWQFVAGHVEEGETPSQTAEREAMEETTCKVKAVNIGEPYIDYEKRINTKWVLIPVLCEYISGEVKIDAEHTEFKWASHEELKKLSLPKNTFEELNKFLKK